MGRMYPEPEPDAAGEEVKKLFAAINNNVPSLLEEMLIDPEEEARERRTVPDMPGSGVLMRANGPTMYQHMSIFGAKLGFALHYEAWKSRVPDEGGAQPMYFTNVNAARGELPQDLIGFLPERQTLRQGSRHVSDQFSYSWALTDEGRHSLFYAVFNEAFAVAVVTALDRAEFLERHADKHPVFVPGAFRSTAR